MAHIMGSGFPSQGVASIRQSVFNPNHQACNTWSTASIDIPGNLPVARPTPKKWYSYVLASEDLHQNPKP